MVRAFSYGAMVIGSILCGGPIDLFLVISQCSTTGVPKAVVCVILSGMLHIKEPLLIIKSSLCGCSRFPLTMSGPLPGLMTHNRK